MVSYHRLIALFLLLFGIGFTAYANTCLSDQTNHSVCVTRVPRRILSLAPNLTEILFDLGAGKQIVGVSRFSDYPIAAKKIPRISDAMHFDKERMLALQPDLIVAWATGNTAELLSVFAKRGIPVYYENPQNIQDLAELIADLGALTGHRKHGESVRRAFWARYQMLVQRYATQKPVKLFYVLWQQPLMTISTHNFLNALIAGCGGKNIFDDTMLPVLTVSMGEVLARKPAIILTHDKTADQNWMPYLKASGEQNTDIAYIERDSFQRYTPKLLNSMDTLCHIIDQKRKQL